MKKIESLVDDIYTVLTDKNHQVEKENAVSLGNAIAALVYDRLSKKQEVKPTLRMSSMGQPCERKLWYGINSKEEAEALPASAKFKFLFGDIIEQVLLFLAKEAGHTVTGEQDELSIGTVVGHRDAVIDGVTVDCKSAASFSYTKFEKHLTVDNDAFGYIDQLGAYVFAGLDDPLVLDKKRGAFLVADKQLGHICLDIHDYTDADYTNMVDHKLRVVTNETPPRRGFNDTEDGKSGNRKLDVNCSYCDRKYECWPTLRTFLYSNGPRYMTRVVKEPDVPELKTKGNIDVGNGD